MKTTLNQKQLLCEKPSLRSWLLDLFFVIQVWSSVVRRKLLPRELKLQLTLRLKHVSKAIPAGLTALTNSATANAARYTGLVLIGIVSPLSALFYRLFDPTIIDKSWYHVNYYYLFHALGVHCFQMFFTTVGFLLVMPPKYKAEYWLFPFIGYPIIKTVLIIYCSSNEEWHQAFELWTYLSVALTGLCFTLGTKFFASICFHKKRVLDCRMDGLFQAPIKPEMKEELLRITWNEIKATKKEY